MTILLTILKIIGIIFLVLLGILLAVILLVLFVPVRYRAEGEYQESFRAKGQITWLLHLLSVHFSVENGFLYSVKVAGIRILPRREKDSASAPEKNKASAPETKELPDAAPSEEVSKEPSEDRLSEKPQAITEEQAAPEPESPEASGAEQKEAARFSVWERLSEKFYAIFRKCREKYEMICAKIEQVREQFSYYIRILKREETKALVQLVISQLKRIIRHILPGKLDVYVHIGTGDPASTGQLLAISGMLYPLFGEKLVVVPDFEEKHVEAAFHMKGKITVFVLLISALRVIINKNFRKLIRILRKKEEA